MSEVEGAPEEAESNNKSRDLEEQASLDTVDTMALTNIGSAGTDALASAPTRSAWWDSQSIPKATQSCADTSRMYANAPSTKIVRRNPLESEG
jgi:hypothetical protein